MVKPSKRNDFVHPRAVPQEEGAVRALLLDRCTPVDRSDRRISSGSVVSSCVGRSHLANAHFVGHVIEELVGCGHSACISSSHPRVSQHFAISSPLSEAIIEHYTTPRASPTRTRAHLLCRMPRAASRKRPWRSRNRARDTIGLGTYVSPHHADYDTRRRRSRTCRRHGSHRSGSARSGACSLTPLRSPRDKSCGGMLNEYAQEFLGQFAEVPRIVLDPESRELQVLGLGPRRQEGDRAALPQCRSARLR